MSNPLISPEKEESKEKKTIRRRVFSIDDLGPGIVESSYLIRGCVLHRAVELRALKAEGVELPFEKFYPLHYGNPQLLGQPPLTFLRQVIAGTFCPSLMEVTGFPEDVKKRVQHYLANIPGKAIGAYSDAQGFSVFRESVANYIAKRDGFPSDPENIYLSDGTLDGMTFILGLLFSKSSTGVMLPFPGFPGYTSLATQLQGKVVPYPLDEEDGWSINAAELEELYSQAYKEGTHVRAIVVINPNNPTGSILHKHHMAEIVKFAYKHGIVIVADEVYQLNVYGEAKFISFKHAVCSAESPYNKACLVSFNSISKGVTGECGVRGGYMEFHNFDEQVMKQVHKVRDQCCVNVAGSIAIEVMCNPPDHETCSKEVADQYIKERDTILKGLAEKARIAVETLNTCKNIKCHKIEGAMYAFPRIYLTNSALEMAKKNNQDPSEYFCKQLLENTGIITVPGNGFEQKPGTYHFRMSVLLWDMKEYLEMLALMKKYIEKFFIDHP